MTFGIPFPADGKFHEYCAGCRQETIERVDQNGQAMTLPATRVAAAQIITAGMLTGSSSVRQPISRSAATMANPRSG